MMDRPLCTKCNKNLASKTKTGFKNACDSCRRSPEANRKRVAAKNQKSRRKARPWTVHKKSFCEKCGFVPEHPCQLDVDHIDGDKKNNSAENWMTLCANCHRLKTYLNRDWDKRKLAS